jgi:phosphoesterase RecJ-like protein
MECSLERIAGILRNADRLVLTAHIHPDGDCLGSLLALGRYLSSRKKHIEIVIDDEIPGLYQFLPGIDSITTPQPDSLQPDLLVVLDASDRERIGRMAELFPVPIVNIDHHVSNTRFADYWYIDSKAAATGEIIFDLLTMEHARFDRETAVCLYTAIATDCGFFRYANTSADTLRRAAQLIENGAQPHIIAEHLDTKPLAALLSLTKALESLELFDNGKIAAITVVQQNEHAQEDTEGLVNYPRNIEGVEVAIMFKFIKPVTARISFRSKRVDVSKLALSFGGGGHARAAGCTVEGSLAEVKERVIAAAMQIIRESER